MNQLFENDDKNFELCKNAGYILGETNIYIPSLMKRLWEKPELVAKIIEKADKIELQFPNILNFLLNKLNFLIF